METPKKKTKMVYVTKYALTKGIEYIEVSETFFPYLVKENIRYPRTFRIGDWFENKEEARFRAELMRTKKILSLQKQIEKLERLSVE